MVTGNNHYTICLVRALPSNLDLRNVLPSQTPDNTFTSVKILR